MQNIAQALEEVKELYRTTLGQPAPDIDPKFYAPFPPGTDPVVQTLEEVRALKRLSESVRAAGTVTWIPRADTFSTIEGYLIHVEIPGVRREDLKVLTLGGELIVRGVRAAVTGANQPRPLFVERPWGPFERRFALPGDCFVEGMKARYQEGVLEVTLPVKAGALQIEKPVEVR
jgi:HSP20 family protein